MARSSAKARSSAAASTLSDRRLPCGCPREEVVDKGHHRRGCATAQYPTGCDSLDCAGDCLVTDVHCDGDDSDE